MAESTTIVPPTPIDKAELQLDAYARFIVLFVNAMMKFASVHGLTGFPGPNAIGVPGQSLGSALKVVHYFIPDGAVYAHHCEFNGFFLGAMGVYGQVYCTVTTDGTGQSALLSGSTFQPRPQLLSGFSGSSGSQHYQRYPIKSGDRLYININSGPSLVALLFEST